MENTGQAGMRQLGTGNAVVGASPTLELTMHARESRAEKLSVLESALTVCVLVFSTTAFVNLFPGEHGLEYGEQGLWFAQILWSFFYVVMLILVRKRIMEFVRLTWQSKPLVLLLGWAGISAAWSISAQVTIRHFVALLFSTLFGVYFGVRYNLRKQLWFVSVALAIVIAASVFACLAFPEYGIGTISENPLDEPAWQGVLSHKNNFATLLMLAALVSGLYFVGRVQRLLIVVGTVVLFCVVVLTQSKTALVYFVLGILAFPFIRAFLRYPLKRKKIVAFGSLIAVGIGIWTYNNWDNFTYSLGKDPGLTGRFMLWGVSLDSIRGKPLLGYGFAAFWSSYYGPAADFRNASGWLVGGTTQNGFINLWLDIGLVGVLLFVASLAKTYRQALKLAKMKKTPEYLWPIAYLTFLCIYSLTEIDFLAVNNLYWILFVAIGSGLRSLIARGYELS